VIDKVAHAQQIITKILVLCAGWVLFIFSFVVTLNVIARKFFSYSIQGVDEYGGYILAISAALGFSQAVLGRAHIRIDIATRRLPLPLRSVAITFAIASLLCTIGYLAYHGFLLAAQSHQMGALATSVLRTPLWIPQALWVSALVWCGLIILVQLVASLTMLVQRRWQQNIDQFDSPTLEAEVQLELDELTRRKNSSPNLKQAKR